VPSEEVLSYLERALRIVAWAEHTSGVGASGLAAGQPLEVAKQQPTVEGGLLGARDRQTSATQARKTHAVVAGHATQCWGRCVPSCFDRADTPPAAGAPACRCRLCTTVPQLSEPPVHQRNCTSDPGPGSNSRCATCLTASTRTQHGCSGGAAGVRWESARLCAGMHGDDPPGIRRGWS
jgi:hypothetical protein